MDLESAREVVLGFDTDRGFRACTDVSVRDSDCVGPKCHRTLALVRCVDDALLARAGSHGGRRFGSPPGPLGTIHGRRQTATDRSTGGVATNADLPAEQRTPHEL